MPKDTDEKFYERADAHIHLANEHLQKAVRGKASASMMYGTSRLNAWISACGFSTKEETSAARQETIEYFVAQYRLMLEENLNDYIQNLRTTCRPVMKRHNNPAKTLTSIAGTAGKPAVPYLQHHA